RLSHLPVRQHGQQRRCRIDRARSRPPLDLDPAAGKGWGHTKGGQAMRAPIGLAIVAFIGWQTAAGAQALPSSFAGTPVDGTYRFVASSRVTDTYVSRGGAMGVCPNRTPGPLSIAHGQARYISETGRSLFGTVGPRGELTMQWAEENTGRENQLRVNGTID